MKRIKMILTILILAVCINIGNTFNLKLIEDVKAEGLTYDYTINYQLNGGVNSDENPSGYNSKTKVKLNKPERVGYVFNGWYSNEKLTKKVTSINKSSSGNITLYAKWTPVVYTIKFNGNKSTSGTMSSMTNRKYDVLYALKENKYKKKGYTFIEWNTKKDGTGTSYKNAVNVQNLVAKNKGTITLYAIWEKDTYTIKYDLNGGMLEKSNVSSYTATDSITLNKPTKVGYVFAGWYSNESLTKKFTKIKKGTIGDLTLYAKWTPITYSIKFNGNRASGGKMTTLTKRKYDTDYTLKSNKYKKKGHTFVEWNTQSDGQGISYVDGASVKNLVNKKNGSITLYAIWKVDTYKIKYELNGGTIEKENPISYSVLDKITLNKPQRDGYVFKGWYTNKTMTKKISSIKKGTISDLTLYAKWEKNKKSN